MEQNNIKLSGVEVKESYYLKMKIKLKNNLNAKQKRTIKALLRLDSDVDYDVWDNLIIAEYRGSKTQDTMKERIMFSVKLAFKQSTRIISERNVGGI